MKNFVGVFFCALGLAVTVLAMILILPRTPMKRELPRQTASVNPKLTIIPLHGKLPSLPPEERTCATVWFTAFGDPFLLMNEETDDSYCGWTVWRENGVWHGKLNPGKEIISTEITGYLNVESTCCGVPVVLDKPYVYRER